ncbi:MAG TPA: hypothetical protein VFY69_10770 [Solirubrobacterales bacterium]|nr:hypothetical protein [Solirubrobacterales bacterium]
MHLMTPRESWTDERLDEFSKRVNQRFDEVNQRLEGLDRRMEGLGTRFDRLTLALVVALIGLIATQL